jgi:hypothetical protein
MLDLVHVYCDFKKWNFFGGSWKVKAVVKRVKTGYARGSREGEELLLSDNRIEVCWILKNIGIDKNVVA